MSRVQLKSPGTASEPTTRPPVTPSRACRRQNLLQPPVRPIFHFPFNHDQCLTNYPGLYYAVLSILTFVYVICSIRTNVCLFLALFLLVITFALTAATYFQSSVGNLAHAATLQKVSLSPSIPVYERPLIVVPDRWRFQLCSVSTNLVDLHCSDL